MQRKVLDAKEEATKIIKEFNEKIDTAKLAHAAKFPEGG